MQSRDLEQKTIVVTGATAGIGLAAAQVLAARGALVIAAGRSVERCEQAARFIRTAYPAARIAYMVADLASQRQIRALAGAISKQAAAEGGGKIDVLINNAGVIAGKYLTTEDGYELTFAVNHLAPFLLTHELLPLLKSAPSARILTVSSQSHRNMRINWSDIMFRRFYNLILAYKQSKLANVLFSAEMNRRLGDARQVRAFAIDPGLVDTKIGLKNTTGIVWRVWNWRRTQGVTPEQGAATVVHVAADLSVEGSNEIYWKDCRPLAPSPYALREDVSARLWELSERLCGIIPVENR